MRKSITKEKIILTVLIVVIGVVSAVGITKKATDPEMHKKTIEALDEKKETVLKLTASSAAVSTALAAIPGDATTPIANKLTDFSSYFLVILTVVFFEKYLVTLTGYLAFQFLIPIACFIAIVAVWLKKTYLYVLALKIATFGLMIFMIIPISMDISNIIEETSEISAEQTMKEAEKLTDQINENKDSKGNIVEKVINKIKGGVTGIVTKGEILLNNFIEMIAIMLVTSCVIPVAVLLFAGWFLKILFGIQVSIPTKVSQKLIKQNN